MAILILNHTALPWVNFYEYSSYHMHKLFIYLSDTLKINNIDKCLLSNFKLNTIRVNRPHIHYYTYMATTLPLTSLIQGIIWTNMDNQSLFPFIIKEEN